MSKSAADYRAVGETIALRLLLVECLSLVSRLSNEPNALFREMEDRLLQVAKRLGRADDSEAGVASAACGSVISHTIDQARRRVAGEPAALMFPG